MIHMALASLGFDFCNRSANRVLRNCSVRHRAAGAYGGCRWVWAHTHTCYSPRGILFSVQRTQAVHEFAQTSWVCKPIHLFVLFLMQTFLRLLLQPHWVCFVRVYHQHRLEGCLLFRRNILGAKGGLWYGGGCGGARPTVHSTESNERFKWRVWRVLEMKSGALKIIVGFFSVGKHLRVSVWTRNRKINRWDFSRLAWNGVW